MIKEKLEAVSGDVKPSWRTAQRAAAHHHGVRYLTPCYHLQTIRHIRLSWCLLWGVSYRTLNTVDDDDAADDDDDDHYAMVLSVVLPSILIEEIHHKYRKPKFIATFAVMSH